MQKAPHRAIEEFHAQHKSRYGFSDEARPVEIVNVRVRMVAPGEPHTPARRELVPGDGRAACYDGARVFFEGRFVKTRFYRRDGLQSGDSFCGPAMITEYTAATVLAPGDCLRVDAFGNLVIAVGKAGRA